MNKLIIALIIAGCGFISFSAIAQDKKDPKAQEIFKGVSAKYKASKATSASFTIVTLDQKSKKTDSQSGTIMLQGDKYRLSLKGQEIISDGKTAWTFIKESNEVQINDVAENSDGISPTSIFTIYEKGFSSKYLGETKVNNATVQQIELVPDDAKKTYFKIQININKAEKVITSAKIFEKNGTHITYTVDKFKLNADIPESTFTFDKTKFPGVEVVDLR